MFWLAFRRKLSFFLFNFITKFNNQISEKTLAISKLWSNIYHLNYVRKFQLLNCVRKFINPLVNFGEAKIY